MKDCADFLAAPNSKDVRYVGQGGEQDLPDLKRLRLPRDQD